MTLNTFNGLNHDVWLSFKNENLHLQVQVHSWKDTHLCPRRWLVELPHWFEVTFKAIKCVLPKNDTTSGIPGGYRLVSTYNLPHFLKWGGYSRVNFGHLKSELFRNGGYSGVNFGHLKSELFWNGGVYSGVNFGHLKSELFQNGGGGAFWSVIPERGFLENLDKNLLFSQKPACASQIVSHTLCVWRLTSNVVTSHFAECKELAPSHVHVDARIPFSHIVYFLTSLGFIFFITLGMNSAVL